MSGWCRRQVEEKRRERKRLEDKKKRQEEQIRLKGQFQVHSGYIIVFDSDWKLNDNYHLYVQMKSGGKLRTLSNGGARTKRSSGSCWRKKSGVPSPGTSGWRRRRRTDATKRKSTR